MMAPVEWSSLCSAFLTVLEEREVKLLTWGVVHGELTEEEIWDLAETFLAERNEYGVDVQELINALRERALLVQVSNDPAGYRTRMAEAVRLFATLRQILRGRKWQLAPTLVADYRLAIRARVYPRRDIAAARALDVWREAGLLSTQREALLSAALGGDRADFQLSGFQVRATTRMLSDLGEQRSRGMIVTVGTGSGKTLAFYLPALTHLATLIRSGEHWTKALAIYPRNELLKDQFAEAYVECRRYDQELTAGGRRKLTIGAFFDSSPWKAGKEQLKRCKWPERSLGYVCPFLRCPKCSAEMLWTVEDLVAGVERLRCSGGRCDGEVGSDEVVLTKDRMRTTPPDVLFTTTESLNRRMYDDKYQRIFGVGAKKKPQLVLLDEVHTYVGTSGAQSALLIRRWRHAISTPVVFCGLSATLRNASEFFATLTGLPSTAIETIEPMPSEGEANGMEYMLALRSDPASRVSVLSTSIQATMLLSRVLDTGESPRSRGIIGSKMFAFADNLDIINRFYHNLLDAEGFNGSGRAQVQLPLAAERSRTIPNDLAARYNAGQVWRIAEEIGHPEGLRTGVRIGRTSSQDSGVDEKSQIIVASPSLEVGFNDPDVGAVLQHKAPRDAASFLQRKGRAGRNRLMRPWTVVVLSDGGRDRLAYQAYEALFNPELAPRTLPVANRYVLRMQAAFSFMEWVALLLTRSEPVGSVFEDFAAPATMAHWDRNKKRRQEKAIEVIEKLLRDEGGLRASLARHLRRALQVDEETVTDLMWQPPRAILTAVAPTILRRLKTEWRRVRLSAAEPPQDPAAGKMPLPDFVPANLFSDLNLPEVQVFAPEFQSEREFNLPIVLAITSLTPGSVTRRFSVMEAKASHWIALPDLGSSEQKMSIDCACESYEEVGVFDTMEDGVAVSVRCVRPLVMRLTRTPRNVLPSSRATPDWRSQVIPVGQGVSFGMPTGSIWLRLVRQVTFFLHNRGSAVESRRFSTGSNATVLFQSGDEFRTRVRYVNSDTAAIEALGFTELVDGVVFECTLPEQVELDGGYHDQAKMRGLRTAYFRYLTITDRELGALANRFQCDRLQETYLSALAAYALSTTGTLESAHRAFTEDLAPRAMEKVLAAVFRTLPTDWTDGEDGDQGEDFDSDDPESYQQKAHTALIKLVYDREVLKVLRRIAPVLWREPDAAFHEWVKRRLHATLGGALLAACLEVNPEAGADQLILDLDRGPRPKGEPAVATSEVWITERTMGGGGVLEEVMVHFADDPRRFFGLAESALAASDFELVDTELTRVLELLSTDKEIRNCAKGVREAGSHSELQQAIEANRRVLEARGVQVTHSVLSALHARVLRPDSGPDSDELLRVLAQHWRDMEETLGVEVDARVFSYIASRDGATIDPVLLRIDPRGDSDIVQWRLRVIHGLVWPRGHAVRAQALETYNPFAALPESDRLLLVDALNADHRPIPLSREAWRGDVAESLRFRGVAKLSCSLEQSGDLQRALLSLACVPVEVGYLQLYPQVDGIERSAAGFVATLYLPEAVQ